MTTLSTWTCDEPDCDGHGVGFDAAGASLVQRAAEKHTRATTHSTITHCRPVAK